MPSRHFTFVALQGMAILTVVICMLLQLTARYERCLLRLKAAFDAAELILWNRPYWDMRTNILDFVACLSILLNCVAMLYFNNDWFINGKNRPEPNGAVNLDNVLGVLNGITVLLILSVFVVTIIEARFKASSARKLSSAVARMVVEVQQELSTSRDEFCILLGETDEKLQPLDAQTVADEVSFKQFQQAAERCIHGKTCHVILEAVFFVLKLINADDNVHSAFITSHQVREEVASARGVPRQLVRAWSLLLAMCFLVHFFKSMFCATDPRVSRECSSEGALPFAETKVVPHQVCVIVGAFRDSDERQRCPGV